MALLLVNKEAKGSKILPKIAYMGQKGGQKGSNNLTIDRVWVKKEVNGSKILPKGGITKNGSKRRSKRVKDRTRELLMT